MPRRARHRQPAARACGADALDGVSNAVDDLIAQKVSGIGVIALDSVIAQTWVDKANGVNIPFTAVAVQVGDPASVAPLLCAGVTTWSPLRHWDVGGKTIGIVGLGGLGHMAVKFAHALGAYVVLFSTSPDKLADAKALGADEAIGLGIGEMINDER